MAESWEAVYWKDFLFAHKNVFVMFTAEINKLDLDEKSHDTRLLKAVLTLRKRHTQSEHISLMMAPLPRISFSLVMIWKNHKLRVH